MMLVQEVGTNLRYPYWYIVKKQFNAGNGVLGAGTPIFTKEWRNTRALIGRYLREPNTEEDFKIIEKAMQKEEADNASSISKRGRPPKNGGE